MSPVSFSISPEFPADNLLIESLTQSVFGPAMLTRAAYALREGVPHEISLSFVAKISDEIVGTVRLTKILWGNKPVFMLGPLGVLPKYIAQGIGKALMNAAVDAAKTQNELSLIVLVGDRDYYSPFGFVPIRLGKITLPRPVDPTRILACELKSGALSGFAGMATRYYG